MHNNASKLINSEMSKNCLIILTKDHHSPDRTFLELQM